MRIFTALLLATGLAAPMSLASVVIPPTIGPGSIAPLHVTGSFAAPRRGVDPLDRETGHAMFDALGRGCVDGGDVDDPFPAAKGDGRAPAFCIPQPCARQLTRAELADEILGRPLRDGEWDAYSARYAEACRTEAVWPGAVDSDTALATLAALTGDEGEGGLGLSVTGGGTVGRIIGGGRPVGTGGSVASLGRAPATFPVLFNRGRGSRDTSGGSDRSVLSVSGSGSDGTSVMEPDPDDSPLDGTEIDITPIPLPPTLLLMLTGLLGLRLTVARRRAVVEQRAGMA